MWLNKNSSIKKVTFKLNNYAIITFDINGFLVYLSFCFTKDKRIAGFGFELDKNRVTLFENKEHAQMILENLKQLPVLDKRIEEFNLANKDNTLTFGTPCYVVEVETEYINVTEIMNEKEIVAVSDSAVI